MQNFRDDTLLVQEIYSFIHGLEISVFSQYPSQTISPCPQPTPQLPLTLWLLFPVISWVAAIKNELLKTQWSIYSVIHPFWENIIPANMAWPEKGKNPVFLCYFFWTDN